MQASLLLHEAVVRNKSALAALGCTACASRVVPTTQQTFHAEQHQGKRWPERSCQGILHSQQGFCQEANCSALQRSPDQDAGREEGSSISYIENRPDSGAKFSDESTFSQDFTIVGGGRVGLAIVDMGNGKDVSGDVRLHEAPTT